MKKPTAFFTLICSILLISAQSDLSGEWSGFMKLAGFDLKLIYTIKKTDSNNPLLAYTSTLSVPQQNAKNIPIDKTLVDGKEILLYSYNLNAEFKGEIDDEGFIEGVFKQSGQTFPLKLIKTLDIKTIDRPQTPTPPYPYNVKEVSFHNPAGNIKFYGTVTSPIVKVDSIIPTIILLSGSGSQDRDETLFDHKPFAVLADLLTRNGFAVLRVDDRGAGKTKCSPKLLNYTTSDLVDDATSYMRFAMDSISKGKPIFIIGHSEGAHIAAVLAHQFPAEIKAIVSLAPPLVSGAEINSFQNKIAVQQFLNKKETKTFIVLHDSLIQLLIKQSQKLKTKTSTEELKQIIETQIQNWQNLNSKRAVNRIKKKFKKIYNKEFQKYIPEIYGNIFFKGKWMMEFIQTEPFPIWSTLSPDALILYGEFDQQVPVELNQPKGERLNKRENIEFRVVPNTNHLFQTTSNGSVAEYSNIEETLSPKVLEQIKEFVLKNQF